MIVNKKIFVIISVFLLSVGLAKAWAVSKYAHAGTFYNASGGLDNSFTGGWPIGTIETGTNYTKNNNISVFQRYDDLAFEFANHTESYIRQVNLWFNFSEYANGTIEQIRVNSHAWLNGSDPVIDEVRIQTDTGNESMFPILSSGENRTYIINSSFDNYLDNESVLRIQYYLRGYNNGLHIESLSVEMSGSVSEVSNFAGGGAAGGAVDEIVSGGGIADVLRAYNPTVYERIAYLFPTLFQATDVYMLADTTGELLRLFIMYVFKQPATLVQTPPPL